MNVIIAYISLPPILPMPEELMANWEIERLDMDLSEQYDAGEFEPDEDPLEE